MLQAGGHSHVAQGFRGDGTQEVGVCRRKGERVLEPYLTRGPGHELFPGLLLQGLLIPTPSWARPGGCPPTNHTWEQG